jgi:hypothetical protein
MILYQDCTLKMLSCFANHRTRYQCHHLERDTVELALEHCICLAPFPVQIRGFYYWSQFAPSALPRTATPNSAAVGGRCGGKHCGQHTWLDRWQRVERRNCVLVVTLYVQCVKEPSDYRYRKCRISTPFLPNLLTINPSRQNQILFQPFPLINTEL